MHSIPNNYMRLAAHTHHLISHITTRPTLTDGTARSHRCNDAQIISQQHKHNALRLRWGCALRQRLTDRTAHHVMRRRYALIPSSAVSLAKSRQSSRERASITSSWLPSQHAAMGKAPWQKLVVDWAGASRLTPACLIHLSSDNQRIEVPSRR